MLLLASVSLAHGGWTTHEVAPALDVPSHLAAADLDGDGDDDLVISSSGDGRLSIIPRTGGAWEPARSLATGLDGASSVVIADLDGDGDPDIASSAADADAVVWLENAGGLAFAPPVVLAMAVNGATSLEAGDLDGDGDADLAFADPDGDQLLWIESLGAGLFGAAEVLVGTGDGPVGVRITDLDGDGDNDLVSAFEHDDLVGWYENLGGGVFAPMAGLGVVLTPVWLDVGHIDADGLPDLAIGEDGTDSFVALANLGGGALAAPIVVGGGRNIHRVYLRDLDGDGLDDMLCAATLDDLVAYLAQPGFTFGAGDLVREGMVEAALVLDVDGDLDIDVLSAAWTNDTMWHLQAPTSWDPAEVVVSGPVWASDVAAADVDGDGDIDLFATDERDRVMYLENTGLGWFGRAAVVVDDVGFRSPFGARLVDVDGDGDLDGVAASIIDDGIRLYENDGGVFGPSIALPDSNALEEFTLGDIDGDGDPDLVVVPFASNAVWHPNTGGTFGNAIGTPVPADRVEVADLDLDGDGDLLIDGSWWENTPVGWVEHVYGAGSVPYFKATDLDGDGLPDIAAGWGTGEVGWYRNQGAGVFGPKNSLGFVDAGELTLRAADVDVDGYVDLAAASNCAGCGGAWLFRGLGAGTFDAVEQVVGGFNHGDSLVLADFDSDGFTDLLTSDESYGNVRWYADADSDGDGLDADEEAFWGTDPGLADTDGDGVDDLDEILADTDPTLADTDGDGVLDGVDLCPGDDALDADFDGVPDGCDVCPGASDALDADGDGVPDGCDQCAGDDRLDADFDGIPDACDVPMPLGGAHAWRRHIVVGPGGVLSTATGDVDGDGLVDRISGHLDGLSQQRGLGGGLFGPTELIDETVDTVESVALADFDGDGDLDLLYASAGNRGIAWKNNVGGGIWAAGPLVDDTLGAAVIRAADLDGDGDPDVVAGFPEPDRLEVYDNLGGGAFGPGTLVANVIEVNDVEVTDVDGDGDRDLVTADARTRDISGLGEITWHENTGGVWVKHVIESILCVGYEYLDGCLYVRDVAVADLTANGHPEVLAAVAQGVRVFPNNGGFFSLPDLYAAAYLDGVETGDIDSDGDPDVVFFDTEGAWWMDNVAGQLGNATVFDARPDVSVSRPHLADLDGDGDPDVLLGFPYDHEAKAYANDGTGLLTELWSEAAEMPEHPAQLAAADVDGDGDVDLVVSSIDRGELLLYRNDLLGVSWLPATVLSGNAPRYGLALGDLTGDGLPEAVWAASLELRYAANTAGVFDPELVIGTPNTTDPRDVVIEDMDGDGVADVLIGSYLDGVVAWSVDPTGLALSSVVSSNAGTVTFVGASDLDEDGEMDAAWLTHDGELAVSRQVASAWQPTSLVAAVELTNWMIADASDLELADMDGDGDLDLVTAGDITVSDYDAAWYENHRGLLFEAETPLLGDAEGLAAIAVGDLGDDRPSVVGLATPWPYHDNPWERTVVIYPDPSGTLGAEVVLDTGISVWTDLVLADMDADGDLDIVTASDNDDLVAWYENPRINPADSDGDGLYDEDEVLLGTDPLLPDTDYDGVDDGQEILVDGTPPHGNLPDGDGDGIPDTDDLCFGDNAFGDVDLDGLCDDPTVDLCFGDDDSGDLDLDGHCADDIDGLPWDCDDDEPTVFPEAEELCDGLDNACAGQIPADEADIDGDGVSVCDGDCDDTDAELFEDCDADSAAPDTATSGGARKDKGGCGCDSAGPSGSGAFLLLLMALITGARRRGLRPNHAAARRVD